MATVSPHVASLAEIVGRQNELAALRAAFRSGTTVQVLTGMGGVGKTSIARAYAQRHLNDYALIWWIRAEDPAAIDAEFRSLLEVLLPPGEAGKIGDARGKTLDLLAHRDGSWLLVLDNVPDASASAGLFPAAGNGNVLITSRSPGWPHSTTVRPLDTEASIELLGARPGDRTAEALAAELGGLPLALTQAASFVRESSIELASYLRLYRNRSADLHEEGRPADYPHTVATTWELAMDRLSENAKKALNLIAFYAPEAIPVNLLLGSWDELDRHRAIGELQTYSIMTPAGSGTVTVHRLVQAVTRNRLYADLTAHEWAEAARALIITAMPREPVNAQSLTTWNTLRAHVRALLVHLPPKHPDTLALQQNLADWTGETGDPAQARDLLAELLQTRTLVLGAEHPDTLTTRHYVAYWTGWAGDAARARGLLTELLPIRQRVLGAEHPDTVSTQYEQARWTGWAGDAAQARELFAEVLPIRARLHGAEHPKTLNARGNLAYWTGCAGDAVGARELFAELLPMRMRIFTADHPHTLRTWNNLARWTGEAGDAAQARQLFAELIPMRERVLGAEHPETLTTRYDLAYWTRAAGDAALAREILAELLPIQERVLGTDHASTVNTRHELELSEGPSAG